MDIKQREALIEQAELAYIDLMGQLDHLFECANFYLQRYPSFTLSEDRKQLELKRTVEELGTLPTQLADVIKKWKTGQPQLLSPHGVEIHLLNEIWVNVQALVYFFISHEIDLYPFRVSRAKVAFQALVQANRLIV